MLSERQVSTLKPGDVFRDWLVDALGDRLHHKKCDVRVFKIGPGMLLLYMDIKIS